MPGQKRSGRGIAADGLSYDVGRLVCGVLPGPGKAEKCEEEGGVAREGGVAASGESLSGVPGRLPHGLLVVPRIALLLVGGAEHHGGTCGDRM